MSVPGQSLPRRPAPGPPDVGCCSAGSTGRRNTRVTLTQRSPNRLQDSRLPAMPKLRFLGRENDPIFQVWFGAFLQELALLGWSIGHNVRVDARWATSNAADIRSHATELVALIPDVILAYGASTVAPEL